MMIAYVTIAIVSFVLGMIIGQCYQDQPQTDGCKFADPLRWKPYDLQEGRRKLREAIALLSTPDVPISKWFNGILYAVHQLQETSGCTVFTLGNISIYSAGPDLITINTKEKGISFARANVRVIDTQKGEYTYLEYEPLGYLCANLSYDKQGKPNDVDADDAVRRALAGWLMEMFDQLPKNTISEL